MARDRFLLAAVAWDRFLLADGAWARCVLAAVAPDRNLSAAVARARRDGHVENAAGGRTVFSRVKVSPPASASVVGMSWRLLQEC